MPNNLPTDYVGARRLIEGRLREPAPGRIQILSGPRQVGKTTLLLEVGDRLRGRSIYAACDGPESALPGFWERLWSRAEERARSGRRMVLLLDEVQHLANWAPRLKGEWDRLRRHRIPVHVVATGSSALRVGTGSRESLAGRFERIVLSHWSASSLLRILGAPRSQASRIAVETGSYPGAFALRGDFSRFRAYVRDAIAEPALGKDVLAVGDVRRPALLRQVFSLCASMPAQIVSLQKLQGRLSDPGALETIAHYLHLLEEAYLVAGMDKFSTSALRRRKSPPKIVVLNNAFLAAFQLDGIPDPRHEPARYGSWVENACLAYAWNSGQNVFYWREEPLEVDAVIQGSWGEWAIEVKSGPFGTRDLNGLLEFCRRYPRFRPLVLTGPGGGSVARRANVSWMRWERFLLAGTPKGSQAP